MTVRNIKKSLAGVEDIATGIGTLQQERGVIHRVNAFPSSYSYIDMQQYEGGDFFRLYGSDVSYTDYRRNPAGTIGIPAGAGGVWEPLTSNDKVIGGSTTNGAYLVDDTYLVWHVASSSNYVWTGQYPHVVAPGTDPTSVTGYVPRTDVSLRSELADNTGMSLIGVGYPGIGSDSDLQDVMREKVNARELGIKNTLTSSEFVAKFQSALQKACDDQFDIALPRMEVSAAGPVYIDHTMTSEGISLVGPGHGRKFKINYSGTGHFLNITGAGDESASPITRFGIDGLWVYGGGNTVSEGGIYIDRAYFVDIRNVFSSGYAKSTAVAVKATNVFNFMAQMFQFANGFPLPQGRASFQVGSVGPDAWNTSNVQLINGACQYGGVNNIEVIHSANILDNFVIDNVTLGKSGLNSIFASSSDITTMTARNCHFESAGYAGDVAPLAANSAHLKITGVKSLKLENNHHQDARTYIDIDSVGAFSADGGYYLESGNYDLSGNTLLKVRTSMGSVNGSFGPANIRTDQIDNLFDYVESGGNIVNIDNAWRNQFTESLWNSDVFPNPKAFKSKIVNRIGSSNAPFDQMYSPDGINWGRMMYSTLYKGERSTNPNGVVTGQAGWFYHNTSGTTAGSPGSVYMIIGWKCTGGTSWKEMRVLTGE